MTHPLAEVFGYPIDNQSVKAKRYRKQKLCPYNNNVPNCTKDKAKNPLGVCSINHKDNHVITCPVRFREEWIIAENAANFLFKEGISWTTISEVRLKDKNGQSAGNIDYVLVSYDDQGKIIDFGSLEVQAVYISGNLRNPFEEYMKILSDKFNWKSGYNYPKPDYLSSSRKRLIPQMLYKGGIFTYWKKKQTVALQKSFFNTLPQLPVVSEEESDIAWLLYDLVDDKNQNKLELSLVETVYTKFESALEKITNPEPSEIEDFVEILQDKLDDKLKNNAPDAPALSTGC